MRTIKVIHVYLIFEKKNYYFGSISAIYDTLDENIIGMKESTLLHSKLKEEGCILTKRAIIRQSYLIRSGRKDSG